MKNNICNIELCQLLKDNGFNERCYFAYLKEYGVKESVMAQYPGLSDCGYQDLTKEYGGEYDEDEIYESRVVLVNETICDNGMLERFNQVSAAPHIFDAKKWVEKKYNVIIQTEYHFSKNDYTCDIFESEEDEICKMKNVINSMVNDNVDLRDRYTNEKEALEQTLINFLKKEK